MYYENVVVFGWAKPAHENAINPVKSLHEARVKVLPNAVCETIASRLTNKIQTISDKYLCTKREPFVIIVKASIYFYFSVIYSLIVLKIRHFSLG